MLIQLRAAHAQQLLTRLRSGAPRTVGTIGDDRVIGVANRDDPGRQRYSLARETIGVALAVDTLVAGAHRGSQVREGLDTLDQLRANERMTAHHDPLILGQGTFLAEDLARHGDLADVVQHRRVVNLARLWR